MCNAVSPLAPCRCTPVNQRRESAARAGSARTFTLGSILAVCTSQPARSSIPPRATNWNGARPSRFNALGLARPEPRSAATDSTNPAPQARCRGVSPFTLGTLASAPCALASRLATAWWFSSTASWRAVLPSTLAALTSAPCSSRKAAASSRPALLAAISGVQRSVLRGLTGADMRSSSARSMPRLPS